MELPLSPTNTRFSEMIIQPERSFCSGRVRLEVAVSQQDYCVVATPFEVGTIELLRRSFFAHIWRHAVIFLVLGTLGAAGCVVGRRLSPETPSLLWFLLTPALLGLTMFFLTWWSPIVGRSFGYAAIIAAGATILSLLLRNKAAALELRSTLSPPVLLWFFGSLVFILVLYATDTGAGPWHANSRFWPARWSSDNNHPMQVAEALIRKDSLDGLLGNWNVSDRPPLQAGFYLLVRLLSWVACGPGVRESHLHYLYHSAGIVVNSLWLPACFFLCRRLGLTRRAAYLTLVPLSFTPFVIFNTVYVWPKMMAGGFGVLALAVLAPSVLQRDREATANVLPITAALVAASLLSHAGGAMFFVGVAAWALARTGLPPGRKLIQALLMGALILTPWLLWQRLVDPPGNALTKMAFAGTFGFDEKNTGLVETIRHSYGQLSLSKWLEMKKDALRPAFFPWKPPTGTWDFVTRRRWFELLFFGPCLATSWVFIASMFVPRRLRSDRSASADTVCRSCRSFTGVVMVTLLLILLAFWPKFIIPHLPYAALLVLILSGLIATPLALGQRGFGVLSGLAIGYSFVVWGLAPIAMIPRVDWTTVVILNALLAAALLWFFRWTLLQRLL